MKRIILDIILYASLLLAMNYTYTRVKWHEYFGLAFFAFVLLHLWWNRGWFTTLFKGRWSNMRIFTLLVNAGLVISLLVCMVTGIVISPELFKGMFPDAWYRSIFVHQLHIASPYVMFILTGIHVGLHWQGLWQRWLRFIHVATRSRAFATACWILAIAISAAGMYGFIRYNIVSKLMFKHMFGLGVPPSLGLYSCYFTAILVLYGTIGRLLQKLITRRRCPPPL